MNCPHCSKNLGHHSTVEYRCIDNKPKSQDYWFCHTCARLVYDDHVAFKPQER